MKTEINKFNEEHTKWESHIHPDNANFMQVVFWHVWVKPDGHTLVGYNLSYDGKMKFLYNMTKEEAIAKFS